MPAGVGYTYQPGAPSPDLPMNAQGAKGGSPQEAIRLLSLRLPKQLGQSAVAPLDLLGAQGGAGAPGGLDALLRALMRAFGQGGTGTREFTPGAVPAIDNGVGDTVRGPNFFSQPFIPPPRIIAGDEPPGGPPQQQPSYQPGQFNPGRNLMPLF